MLRFTIAACAASLTLASTAFAAPDATADDDSAPGRVIQLPVHPVAPAPAAASPAPATTPASDADPGAITGFTIEGRIAQTLAPIDLDATTPYHLHAAPPVIALGYRGDGYALAFGPVLDHYEWGNQVVNVVGLSAHVEADVLQSADRKNEGYVLAGGSVAMAALNLDTAHVSGHPAIGLFGGFGARHWVTRNLGVSVEIGEGFAILPRAATNSDSNPGNAGALTTFGTLGLTLVL